MNSEYRPDPYGKIRLHQQIFCDFCKIMFWRPKHQIKSQNFCSIKCRGKNKQKRFQTKCVVCSANVTRPVSKIKNSRSGLIFCSRKCKEYAQSFKGSYKEIQPKHYGIGNGKFSYREWAIKEYGHACEICRWYLTVEVHHIDGNRENNNLNNLCVLCPNHHSLTVSCNNNPVEQTLAEDINHKVLNLRK